MWGDLHHLVSCMWAIRAVRHKVIPQQTRNVGWASMQAALEPAASQHAKRVMQNLGKICEWQTGGKRSHHFPVWVCYGPCCETASRTPAQHHRQVMEQERLWEAPQKDKESWHGAGGRAAASFSTQKRDTGGTGGCRHVARQWKPCISNLGWWPKDETIFSTSLRLRIHPGLNWIPGQSKLVRLVYKPVPSPCLQPVQEKSIF